MGLSAKDRYQRVRAVLAQDDAARPKQTAAPKLVFIFPPPRVTGGAALGDVLYDQFEFLVDHSLAPNCKADCPTCKRLQHVIFWLTLPFQEKPDSE